MIVSEVLIVFSSACLCALCALYWLSSTTQAQGRVSPAPQDAPTFLFDGGVLHHASDAAQARFAITPNLHEWDDLRDTLKDGFPDFPDQQATTGHGNLVLTGTGRNTRNRLDIRWEGALCWVTLSDATVQPDVPGSIAEIAALRRASDTSSSPAWQSDMSGDVTWCNAAYRTLYRMAHGHAPQSDIPLFDRQDAAAPIEKPTRVALRAQGSDTRDWYELSAVEVDGVTCYRATCINAVVDAEDAQRKFVQTLAKTFAQLSIGLAIFDRNGQLALFNPALVDLTRLRAEFLSGRPTLMSFFDGLRENRRMPEPKNYGDWRQRIAELIAAATDGRFEETWSLETGETFRVKGRPHPDGATAFLIEDISAEVTLTRNFRAELELGQSLLDQIDDAIAVFSASGVLTFCNAAYRDLWSVNPDASFADVTISDSIDVWKRQAAPNPMWPDVEEFVRDFASRDEWDMPIYLKSGEALTCHIAPVVAGATLVRFTDAHNHRSLVTRHRLPASDQT